MTVSPSLRWSPLLKRTDYSHPSGKSLNVTPGLEVENTGTGIEMMVILTRHSSKKLRSVLDPVNWLQCQVSRRTVLFKRPNTGNYCAMASNRDDL